MRDGRLQICITLLALVIVFVACGGNRKQTRHKASPDCVYVCSGHSAKRYHSVEDCKGLSRCSGSIVEMTVEEAENKGRTPCRMCVR